jgi:hypothetical protein
MKFAFITMLLLFLSDLSAQAACGRPNDVSVAEAPTIEFRGSMFGVARNYGYAKFSDWSTDKVKFLEDKKCYLMDSILAGRGRALGSIAINNHIDTGGEQQTPKFDLTLTQLRLSQKSRDDAEGNFTVRLARSSEERGCTWYRGQEKLKNYSVAGQAADGVARPGDWNAAHSFNSDILSADRVTAGEFHGSASVRGPSTFNQRTRERFRFAEELTKEFDVQVVIRLVCFDRASNSIARMVPFDVEGGTSGLIVSYFSASADLAGVVRLCREPFCEKIEGLEIGTPYSGILAGLVRFIRR